MFSPRHPVNITSSSLFKNWSGKGLTANQEDLSHFSFLFWKQDFYAINVSLILELIDVRLMRISEAKLCRSFPEKFANIKFWGGRGRKENNPTLKNWKYSVEHILANILAIDIHSNHKKFFLRKKSLIVRNLKSRLVEWGEGVVKGISSKQHHNYCKLLEIHSEKSKEIQRKAHHVLTQQQPL